MGSLAIALESGSRTSRRSARCPRHAAGGAASPELGLSYAILNRHLFMNRQDLHLPTAMLLDAAGSVVRAYRDRVDAALILRDAATIEAPPAERLARAVPFAGTLYSPPALRNYLSYGRELLDQGLDAAAVEAFERAAQAKPSAPTLYRLGTLLAGAASRIAHATLSSGRSRCSPISPRPATTWARCSRGEATRGGHRTFSRGARSTPEYPDALNNLGYALLLTGHNEEARALYEKALALQPDFPEALNNLGLLVGRAGDLDRAERYFREALARRADYGEAANNLALVLVSRGQEDEAVRAARRIPRESSAVRKCVRDPRENTFRATAVPQKASRSSNGY